MFSLFYNVIGGILCTSFLIFGLICYRINENIKECLGDVDELNHINNVIDVKRIEIVNNDGVRKEVGNKDKIHFSKWLSYLYKITDKKPDSKSNLYWKDLDIVLIHYNHNGTEYTIHLTEDFENVNNKQIDIIKDKPRRNIVNANVIKENQEGKNITKDLKKFLGPNCDFHQSFKNVSKDINHILHNLDLTYWDKINITDSFGNTFEIDIKNTKVLDWNPEFSL